MKTRNTITCYNQAVLSAFAIIQRETLKLIASLEQPALRECLIRKDDEDIIYQLVHPLLLLSLEVQNGRYTIQYGFQQFEFESPYTAFTAAFVRLLYKFTSHELNTPNIENCISTKWLVANCDELYSYVEMRQLHHEHKLIRYKARIKVSSLLTA